jgi:hypothetical protein
MEKKYIWAGAISVLVLILLGWLYVESSKPTPGQKITSNCSDYTDFSKIDSKDADKCRVHVPLGLQVNYQSNPPVFGPHYSDWTKSGVYEQPLDDRNLVHSLEHGYVVMSYKCNLAMTPIEASGSAVATPSGNIDTQDICNQRKEQLVKVYDKKGHKKLIVAARSNIDSNFALTAWGFIDKFDNFDQKRVEDFVSGHLDNGPERTME